MKFRALAATGRIANIPSVICNVALGIMLAAVITGGSELRWLAPLPLILTGILLYLAGNFLNDWLDRSWDCKHRPERALPCGIFASRSYLAITIGLAVAGLGIAALTELASAGVAAGILVAIGVYTVWHKRSPWAVIPMGLCRGLLPLLGAVGYSNSREVWLFVGICGLGHVFYIAGLSLSARYESLTQPPTWISPVSRTLFLLAAVTIYAVAYRFSDSMTHRLLGVLPYFLWLALCLSRWRKPLPVHVSRLLAGIPWLDAIAFIPLGLTAGVEPFTLICLLLPASAFLAAIVLQRCIPAT